MMEQKDYRDFAVGELLDDGFDVRIIKHRVNDIEKAENITSKFEGTKQSSVSLDEGLHVHKAQKNGFEVSIFRDKTNY